jgi:lipoate-protein ligase A
MIVPYPLSDAYHIELGLSKAAIYGTKPDHACFISTIVPEASYVSLGASNKAEQNVNLSACQQDGVKVFKRLSGGEAVFLSPNCVVYSQVLVADNLPKSSDFFASNLEHISLILNSLGVLNITRKGISDLALGDKKILGSAIYRKTHFILFQAVLNVCEAPELIERYLLYPQREPDYRKGRAHSEFITSLHLNGYSLSPQVVANSLCGNCNEV